MATNRIPPALDCEATRLLWAGVEDVRSLAWGSLIRTERTFGPVCTGWYVCRAGGRSGAPELGGPLPLGQAGAAASDLSTRMR